jgi:hypothetical protein
MKYLIAIALLFMLMLGWVAMQHVAQLFARRHPEFGPVRDGLGCGSSCSCSKGSCSTRGG